ncbi:hypothetical protein ACFVZR_05380 [Streptomyces sp. NPDC058316]|uniref:hypothetical protein n=1 Tax=unclassified Streptomyces TaxID=2593676 RepID=UPI00331BAB88
MNLSQNTAAQPADAQPRTGLTLSRKAALGVAAAAVIGGSMFAPSAFAASDSAPSHAVEAGCGDCYPDVI